MMGLGMGHLWEFHLSRELQIFCSAESVIRDSDLAEEVANYTKHLILTEAAAAASAQTNRMDPDVLRLLINHR